MPPCVFCRHIVTAVGDKNTTQLRDGGLTVKLWDTARKTGVASHLSAWRSAINSVKDMINDGAIGTLREVHNWTDRPFWPQWQSLPAEQPPVPKTFDWNLWLGPPPSSSAVRASIRSRSGRNPSFLNRMSVATQMAA
jgi:hypothetical protein